MAADGAFCPSKFLSPLSTSFRYHPLSPSAILQRKSFAQALNNSCDVPYSQLPRPCLKGEELAIKIPEDEYRAGLEGCKNHLHGRIILSKGDLPLKLIDFRAKLASLWKHLGHWSVIPLGKEFYEFSFVSTDDLRSVWSIGSWSLKPSILRLPSWTPYLNPHIQK